MEFKKIHPNTREFEQFWTLYEEAFPSDERRNREQQIQVLNRKQYELLGYFDHAQLIGFMASWKFDTFTIFEHLAIQSHLRNKGLGSQMIKEYIKGKKERFVVEIEKPEVSEQAKRRVRFYKRIKFYMTPYPYTQPAYSSDKNPVKMRFLSHPKKMSKAQYNEIRRIIHQTLYGLKEPIED